LTLIIAGFVQLYGNRTNLFSLDCDQRIELVKIKLKQKAVLSEINYTATEGNEAKDFDRLQQFYTNRKLMAKDSAV
jgi:hypothetical protein